MEKLAIDWMLRVSERRIARAATWGFGSMISSLLLAATFASLGLELPALLAQFMLGFTCLHFGLLGFWVLLRGGYRDWKGHAREGLFVRFEGFLLMLLAWGFLAWGLLSAP